jgi:hypothetical protein
VFCCRLCSYIRITGRFQIDGITPTESGESRKIKLKVRLNQNGIFAVSSAVLVDTVEVPVKVDDAKQQQPDKPEPMDTSTPAQDTSADADVDDLLQRYEQEMKSDEATVGLWASAPRPCTCRLATPTSTVNRRKR